MVDQGVEQTADLGGNQSLKLPENFDNIFRNIKDAKIFAMDIGGSLTKIAYYSTLPCKKLLYESMSDETSFETFEGARLHFIKFETQQILGCLEYICRNLLANTVFRQRSVTLTGGGAYKYYDLIEQNFSLPIHKADEMKCLILGCNFLLKNIANEVFLFHRNENPQYEFVNVDPSTMYPYLLVTIGSGVSILKAESDTKFERVGGTATGGGTFLGLGRLLTNANEFQDLLDLADLGDHRNVDMLVKDIYGDRKQYTSKLGLTGDIIASSMGKMIDGRTEKTKDADLARSLLYLVSNDIGQIASLYALIHDIKTVYFGGFFIRHHPVSMQTIAYAINFWSKNVVRACFLRHEGYLGAIGAFMEAINVNHADYILVGDDFTWTENLFASSSFEGNVTQLLEMDRFDSRLGFCPLLHDSSKYVADTVELVQDYDARNYWLNCFQESLPKFTERAFESQGSSDARRRADEFSSQFLLRLSLLKNNPVAHGNLTVRALLDMREHVLSEFDFYDPYIRQKVNDNKRAFALLESHLVSLRQLDRNERLERLFVGLLAGNVFDWGAKEVALLMEDTNSFTFDRALDLVEKRPWLVDDLDAWTGRFNSQPSYRCIAIFIDNSGFDIVLGVLPLVIEFLEGGSEVLLCANNHPVLNDVTFSELINILHEFAKMSHVISRALANGQLLPLDSGQSSPCLDLARLNNVVNMEFEKRGVDLIILEGMGRAIHTNLYAKFICDSLNVAVLKNQWLAERLGGNMFSVVFKFTRGTPRK